MRGFYVLIVAQIMIHERALIRATTEPELEEVLAVFRRERAMLDADIEKRKYLCIDESLLRNEIEKIEDAACRAIQHYATYRSLVYHDAYRRKRQALISRIEEIQNSIIFMKDFRFPAEKISVLKNEARALKYELIRMGHLTNIVV